MNDNMVQYFVITTRKVVLLNPTKAGIVVPGGWFHTPHLLRLLLTTSIGGD